MGYEERGRKKYGIYLTTDAADYLNEYFKQVGWSLSTFLDLTLVQFASTVRESGFEPGEKVMLEDFLETMGGFKEKLDLTK